MAADPKAREVVASTALGLGVEIEFQARFIFFPRAFDSLSVNTIKSSV